MLLTTPSAISSSKTRFSTIKQVQRAFADAESRAWADASWHSWKSSSYLVLIPAKPNYSIWQISASRSGNHIILLLYGDKGSILAWANSLRA